jgi:hypothetical protein
MNNNQTCKNIVLSFFVALIIFIVYFLITFDNNLENKDNKDNNSCSYLPPKNIKPNTIEEIVAEFDKDNDNDNNNEAVFNFKPLTDENNGALIDEAYKNIDVPILKPNDVNIRKNNVTSYNAHDFLPKEINTEWFDTDFSQAKHNISDDKLINTEKYVIGINTVGQSLKNPTYDIRGTIPNPKYAISPWNNSTYEPDYNLKSLC